MRTPAEAALPTFADLQRELPPSSPRGRGALGRAIDERLLLRRTCVAFRDIRLIAERTIGFNVQTRNPEIEYIPRVWRNAAGERCVWRLRPGEQILGYAEAAAYRPASVTADRFGIYRAVRREATR